MIKLWSRELACRQVVDLLTDYLEGALPSRRRASVERHLAGCPDCGRYLEQMRMTIRLVGRVEPGDVPAPAMDELLEVFRQVQADED